MELIKRKRIRIKDYDYSTSGAYFITVCTYNRLSILSQIVGQGLSDIVCVFKSISARKSNIKLWQSSFYDHVIRDESDYLEIVEYIENNPAKWQEDKYFEG